MKGKHANKSARRREELCESQIRDLQSQLRESQDRCVALEATAARLTVYEQEIERLRRQVADGTSERVQELETEVANAVERLKHARDMGRKIDILWNRLFKLAQAKLGLRDDHEGFEHLARLIGAWGQIFEREWDDLRHRRVTPGGAGMPIAGSARSPMLRFDVSRGRKGVPISPEGGLNASNLIVYNTLEFLRAGENERG